MKVFKTHKIAALAALVSAVFSSNAYAAYCSYGSFTQHTAQYEKPYLAQFKATISSGLTGGNIRASLTATQTELIARITAMEQTLLAKMTMSDATFVTNTERMAESIVTQMERLGASQIQANTAIASYEEKEDARAEINELTNKYEQPITNCLHLSAGKSFPNTLKGIRKQAANNAKAIGSSVANSVQSKQSWQQQEYARNAKLFRSNGSELQDGDVQASVLFGSLSGGKTRPSGIQDEALKSVTSYLTGLAYVPKAVDVNQAHSAAGQDFALLQRRNAAFTSLSQYVLDSIAQRYEARSDLKSFFTQAKLTMNEEQKSQGVSISELMELYVKKMMSKEQISSLAQATDSMQLLRSIAQNDGMSLFMMVQELNSAEQMEMMQAAELSLLTQDILGEKAQYYRQDAVNRTGFKDSK